jgi:hypothetical protein
MLNKSVVGKFALDTDFQDSYKRLDEHKWYSASYTTRVREVENYGAADEHQVPGDIGRGLTRLMMSAPLSLRRSGLRWP